MIKEWLVLKNQELTQWYNAAVEPWLDAMSNGEATLFGIVFAALAGYLLWLLKGVFIWLGEKIYKPFKITPKQENINIPPPETSNVSGIPIQAIEETITPEPVTSTTPAQKLLPHTSATKLFGRRKELTMLTRAWKSDKQNIVVLKAMGGTGKTALLKHWLDGFNDANTRTPPDVTYTWSFYSQGSAEDKQASADEFFDKALSYFKYQGDRISSSYDKGIKLAELINQQRTLLVLDGLEPLQYPVGTMRGDLKDKGLIALLQKLASHNKGLCLISSRQNVVELADKPLVVAHDLGQLQTPDGVELLKSFGIHAVESNVLKFYKTHGDEELKNAVSDVSGHALALILMGNYVKTLFNGDIRQRDKIKNLNDERAEGTHAETVMVAYEVHLKGTTALSILYMMGLFDRPVSAGAIQHLRDAKVLDLTDQLGDENDWLYALEDLREQQLLNSTDLTNPDTLDTHPLIREYFAKCLKSSYPEAWLQAHSQLYDYYKALPIKEQPDTREEMEPLFAAIVHGCAAGMYQEALDDVYWPRIRREEKAYIAHKLGLFGTDLSTLSQFFTHHWHTPAKELIDEDKAVVLSWTAFSLRAVGRLQESVELMQASIDLYIQLENWKEAAANASNLSEVRLTKGEVLLAIKAAQQSVVFADKSNDEFSRIAYRTILADALHQAEEVTDSRHYFQRAETLQEEWQKDFEILDSVWGFRYCDLLLAAGKWKEVWQRVKQTYENRIHREYSLLAIALDKLSFGRVCLQQVIDLNVELITAEPSCSMVSLDMQIPIERVDSVAVDNASLSTLQLAEDWLEQAVEDFRKSGAEHQLPRGLLARVSYYRFVACYFFSTSFSSGYFAKETRYSSGDEGMYYIQKATQDLQEVYEIALRGGMLLHLTDYHLESARLILSINQAQDCSTDFNLKPFDLSASEHIQKAKHLIEETGYKRRTPEVEYLEAFINR